MSIEEDKDHKKVIVKKKSKELEEFLKDKKWDVSEETVQVTYDNMTMSK